MSDKVRTREEANKIIEGWTKSLESAINDACEKAYWQFDARKKGYTEWEGMPQSERDAFKAECYMIAKRYILEPENDISQALANDVIEQQSIIDAKDAEIERLIEFAESEADEYTGKINQLKSRVRELEFQLGIWMDRAVLHAQAYDCTLRQDLINKLEKVKCPT